MFEMEGDIKWKKIAMFNDMCKNKTLQECYKNNILLGSKYPDKVEKKIKLISDVVDEAFQPSPWADLMD